MARDIRDFGAIPDGTTDNSAAINAGLAAGDIVIRNGVFRHDSAIVIPSNRKIDLENCKLFMGDNTYDNHFRNAHFDAGDSNIQIIGHGNVSLEQSSAGNDDPDYSEYGGVGGDNMYKTARIIMCNVNNFKISGLNVLDRVAYFINLQKATNGELHDIYLNTYSQTQNQDGIAIRQGSNNLKIYNIEGNALDDFLSINCGKNQDSAYKLTGWRYGDVHDIEMYNFNCLRSGLGSLFALITGDGNKVYNINSHNHITRGGTVFFNGYGAIYDVAPVKADIHDIVMDSIVVNANTRDYLHYFQDDMMDITFTNITNNTVKGLYTLTAGDQSDNVTINGVQVT